MQKHAPGSAVPVTFSLINDAGEVLEPTALRWRVLDEDGLVVSDWAVAALDPEQPDQITLTLAAEFTTLAAGALRGIRSFELELTLPSGVQLLSSDVLIAPMSKLSVGVNSFCTYQRALMLSEDFTEQSLTGWVRESSREARESALIEAHRAILRLPVRYAGVHLAAFLDSNGIADLDAKLIDALRQAQLLEASEILNADPTVIARRNGLLSMTVGESSQFFGQSKQLETPVLSRVVYKILAPWISHSIRIGRA